MEIPISENGKIQKQMDMEFIYGKMEIDTKESGEHVSSMARDLIYSQMLMYTLVIIKMESLKDMVSISGKTVQFMMEILRTV
jgi:hypothetical protein